MMDSRHFYRRQLLADEPMDHRLWRQDACNDRRDRLRNVLTGTRSGKGEPALRHRTEGDI